MLILRFYAQFSHCARGGEIPRSAGDLLVGELEQTVVGSRVLFRGEDSNLLSGLFAYDTATGTAGEIIPANAYGRGLSPLELSSDGALANFYGVDSGGYYAVWQTDGFTAGTVELSRPGGAQEAATQGFVSGTDRANLTVAARRNRIDPPGTAPCSRVRPGWQAFRRCAARSRTPSSHSFAALARRDSDLRFVCPVGGERAGKRPLDPRPLPSYVPGSASGANAEARDGDAHVAHRG